MSIYSRDAEDFHTGLIEAYYEGLSDARPIGQYPYVIWNSAWSHRFANMCHLWMKDVHGVVVDLQTVLHIWEAYEARRNKR